MMRRVGAQSGAVCICTANQYLEWPAGGACSCGTLCTLIGPATRGPLIRIGCRPCFTLLLHLQSDFNASLRAIAIRQRV